jgi:sirohydrochlorin cobaltochelatase
MTRSGIILFAHGARDPQWAKPFQRIQAMLTQRVPQTPVELAFLELMRPNLAEAMCTLADRGVERITLVPLFMAQGNHLRRDLPEIVRAACTENPGLSVRTATAIGEVDALLDAIAAWIIREESYTRDADLGNPVA